MSIQIEARAYGPDSTPAEIQAMLDRVSVDPKGYVLFREVPVCSPFQIEVCYRRIAEVAAASQCSKLIIDLQESKRPDAEIRAALKNEMIRMQDIVKTIAVFTGKNFLINVAAKFVLSGVPQKFSVHKTRADAEEAVLHAAK